MSLPMWPEIGILRRAGDGHALEVSLACRVGLALDAIRRRGRSRWGMSPLVGEAVGGSVPGVLWGRGDRGSSPYGAARASRAQPISDRKSARAPSQNRRCPSFGLPGALYDLGSFKIVERGSFSLGLRAERQVYRRQYPLQLVKE